MTGVHLVPSLNRIDNLVRMCKSLKESETKFPGWVIVDKKDFESKKSTYTELKHDYFLDNWDFRVTEGVTMAQKVAEVWPELETMGLDWVNLQNDDHEFITPHWDTRLAGQITGKNFINCNDRWNAPMKAAGATMISMELLKVWGFPIFPPGLQHLFIDDFLERLGDYTGCRDIDMSIVVEHRHVFKRESPLDQTHQKTYARPSFQADHDVYQKFLQTEMPALIERVKKFIEDVTLHRQAHG